MRHIVIEESDQYDIALLVKDSALDREGLMEYYVNPLGLKGILPSRMIGFNLKYNEVGKCPVKFAKAYLANLMKALDSLGVTTLYVCDSVYFKILTGTKKVEAHYGYQLPCVMKEYEHMNVVIGANYKGLYYNPDLQQKIDLTINTLADNLNDNYVPLGEGIIHSEAYPLTYEPIKEWLDSLHQYPSLSCDIEAFSLKFWKAGIATIGFAWDKHNGISFPCDYVPYIMPRMVDGEVHYGKQRNNLLVKKLIYDFLISYKGKLVYHNANYDVKVLVFELFMNGLLDQEGMIEGINILTRNIDDTKLITYLATNSCAGNTLGLKPNSHEFAGNYAEESINDVRKIPLKQLLTYNLIDCLCTWHVYGKYYPMMVNDLQLDIYKTIKLPSVKVILQVELTGMPLDMPRVHDVKTELETIEKAHRDALFALPLIKTFLNHLRQKESDKCHAKWKQKTMPLSHFDYFEFNPNSNLQVQELLYDFLGYEPIDFTKSKQPAVGAKTIAKLKNQSSCDEHTEMFEALIGLTKVTKILTTFIVAFIENSVLKEDGVYYLHGSFNIGGTVSGRLSASAPNLQTIPSGSTYAKLIKSCFVAPDGWIMVGCDFASLEDRISALTTKDPMKLKVYTDGYDGHCLRAFSYFGNQMEGIDGNSVVSINSIEQKYEALRQESKAPTFALTYQGMWKTLVNNLGWSEEKAKDVEKKYHELYVVSDNWVADKLREATNCGYVTTAFGLRVRTPILSQSVLNARSTPFEAAAEGRTAGNALGQGYCMLNNRAGIEFQDLTFNSPYALDIRPIAHIHDAQYFLVREDIATLEWLNNNLVKCMQWQELPEIQHAEVKLGGNLEVYYPSWAKKFTIPNNSTQDEIQNILTG